MKDVHPAIVFTIALLLAAVVGLTGALLDQGRQECMTFHVGVAKQAGTAQTILLGEQEVCASNWEWGSIKGPIQQRGDAT